MNKLRQVSAEVRRLSAAEAELWFRIDAEKVTPTTEVRGRMIGPRCPGITTIEVAYPLRPFPRHPEGMPPLSRRVAIPDPSLWEPDRPFVYHAIIELWQDGARCDGTEFDYGLRMGKPAVERPKESL
jgi:hypothetical protein